MRGLAECLASRGGALPVAVRNLPEAEFLGFRHVRSPLNQPLQRTVRCKEATLCVFPSLVLLVLGSVRAESKSISQLFVWAVARRGRRGSDCLIYVLEAVDIGGHSHFYFASAASFC